MRIIIVGGGQVGFSLSQALSARHGAARRLVGRTETIPLDRAAVAERARP